MESPIRQICFSAIGLLVLKTQFEGPIPDRAINSIIVLENGSLSVAKSRMFGSVSSGSVVLSEVRDYPAS